MGFVFVNLVIQKYKDARADALPVKQCLFQPRLLGGENMCSFNLLKNNLL